MQKPDFCVSLLNRLIQTHPDHGASMEPKNPIWTRMLMQNDPSDLGLFCLLNNKKNMGIYESNLGFPKVTQH